MPLRETILTFDIETVPDAEAGRRLLGLDGRTDAEVIAAMAALRRQDKGHDFQPPHLHRIVSIAIALRREDEFRVLSLGDEDAPEAELVRQFFGGIEKYRPTLVSWNGSGFDLPVLHYRALRHSVPAPRYWDTGQGDREARWDNYLGRYQFRHTDVMDVLAYYQARAFAPLHEIALLLGLPGKLGLEGARVLEAWQAGRLTDIRAYCETDVLNTYLIWLRFQLLRGQLDAAGHAAEVRRVREFLEGSAARHWKAYLEAWDTGAGSAAAR